MVRESAVEGGGRETVLVVDDEGGLRELFVRWVENNGWRAVAAGDGTEALEHLDPSIDVVLLDRNMPGLGGDAVLRELRARGLDCRVALVTAVEPDVDIVDMAFDAYVRKPVDETTLRETVERLLARSAYDRAAREQLAALDKLAALEATYDRVELERRPEYQELCDRVQDGEQSVQSALTALGDPREALKEL